MTATRVKRQFIRTRCEVSASGALTIFIGIRTRNPLNGSAMHWGEKKRQKDKFKAAVAVARPLAVNHITFTRWAPPRSKGFDDDAIQPSFKWIRDAACEWLGLPNDSATCGVTFSYEQFVGDAYGVTVRFQ